MNEPGDGGDSETGATATKAAAAEEASIEEADTISDPNPAAKKGRRGKKRNQTAADETAAAGTAARTASAFPAFVETWCRLQGLTLPKLHAEMANWLAAEWAKKKRPRRLLLLAFRGAGKSTLVGLFSAWLLANDPALRILALSADLALARKMVRTVKRLIETHPETQGLKPKNPELWGSDQFTVVRRTVLRDPSMLARGIDGNFTGSRADVIICDDVEVPGNSDTPAKRAALRERLGEIEFVLVPDGAQLYLGTPHSFYSIYADKPRAETGEQRPFLDGFARKTFPVVNGRGSVWPERFSARALKERQESAPRKFASQMMLQPTAPEACRLDAGKLLRYSAEPDYREAQGRGTLWLEGRKLASMRVWWDPAFGRTAKASRNVIAAVYQDEAGGYWLHRVVYFGADLELAKKAPEKHPEAEQLCRAAAKLAADLGAPAITVEDNGIGKFVPGLLRKALARIGCAAAVMEHTARVPKGERILAAFDVTLAAGLLHAHDSVCDGPFAEEMNEWVPGGKSGIHDDALDAVAGAITAEPTRLGPFPRPPVPAGAWRPAGIVHKADTDFTP